MTPGGMGVVVLAARACGRAAERSTESPHDATQPDSDLGAGSSADGSLDATSPSKEPSVSALDAGLVAFERRSRVDATQTCARL